MTESTEIYTTIINDVVNAIILFANSSRRNEWITVGPVSAYVRNTRRVLNDNVFIATLDIANITISDQYTGVGIGTAIIEQCHQQNPHGATFIESLVNDGWYARLKSNGWIDKQPSIPPCVFKLTT